MTSREWSYVCHFDIPESHPQYNKLFATSLAASDGAVKLNRYSDIVANESTLFPSAASPMKPRNHFSDLMLKTPFPYLNANYFEPSRFCNSPHAFVACQAPMASQTVSFWQTVIEYQVPIIFMLTRLHEEKAGRKISKAHPYWPEAGQPLVSSETGITVEAVSLIDHFEQQIVIRKFKVTKGAVSHTVEHIHYLGWADHNIPDNDAAFMHLVTLAESVDPRMGPIFVHCSAGIGRTGTLMGVYYGRHWQRVLAAQPHLQQQLAPTGIRNAMLEIVCKMKRTRNGMVQKPDQLKYMLTCLGCDEVAPAKHAAPTISGPWIPL